MGCRFAHRQCQLFAKRAAVGQTGQGVAVGQKFQPLLLLFLLGNISEHAHVVGDVAIGIAHGRQRHVLGEHLAVFAFVPDFALPVAGALNAVPHGLVERLVVAPGLEQARRQAQQLLFGVAQHPRQCRVDGEDVVLHIGHEHGLSRVVHHGGSQALALLGRALVRQVGQDA